MVLLLKLTWRTLFSRPTLAILTTILLALSTACLSGWWVTNSALGSLRVSMINGLVVEIELSDYSDSTRFQYAEQLRQRSDVLQVASLSARNVLEEVEEELGESLREVLTDNPFPPIIRVKLRDPSPLLLEQFAADVGTWQGVLRAVYPKDLWRKFDIWMEELRGKIAWFVVGLAMLGWVLAGLSFRAILRSRRSSRDLLLLLGLRPRDLETVQLLLEIAIGLFAGLLAAGIIQIALIFAEWLLLSPVSAPPLWIPACLVLSVLLAILAGIWAPKPDDRQEVSA